MQNDIKSPKHNNLTALLLLAVAISGSTRKMNMVK